MRNVAPSDATGRARAGADAGVRDGAPRQHPRSSDRVLQLLATVGGSARPLSLTEAAAIVGLVPSTALRQLRSLEAAGLLVRSDEDQMYRPGPQLIALARRVFTGHSLVDMAQPLVDQLAAVTGESAYLAVAEGARRARYVATSPGHHALRHSGWLGRTFATPSTAVGAALRGRVDADGVVCREGSLETGITAISAPVRARDGVVAAISLVGPTFRLEPDLDAARRAVAACAARLSAALC
jgi:urocanate hydratase